MTTKCFLSRLGWTKRWTRQTWQLPSWVLKVTWKKTLLTSCCICMMNVWNWKNRILGIFTAVRYHFKMSKLFYKLPSPFPMWGSLVLFFFALLCFWESKAVVITWEHWIFSHISTQLNKITGYQKSGINSRRLFLLLYIFIKERPN